MFQAELLIKEIDASLREITDRLRDELRMIRSSRPSVELLEQVKVNYYDQQTSLKQLGSLSLRPPRAVEIQVWDKSAMPAVMKAIEEAKIGMSVVSDGNAIRASLPVLTDERREEMARLAKKAAEASRIQIRSHRDEQIKKLKAAQENGEIAEDAFFKAKEKVQELTDGANKNIETALEQKIKEIEE